MTPPLSNDKPGAVGRVPPRGASPLPPNAASGDAAYNRPADPAPNQPRPRRLRRLHRVWPDRDGNISYLLTICVEGRAPVLNNDETFQRLVGFLLDSPARYHWFGRRFVLMPDHLHLIAHMGYDAVRLGQWIKAMKAVVGGLKPRDESPARLPDLQSPCDHTTPTPVGPAPPPGVPAPGVPAPGLPAPGSHDYTRLKRPWRWQAGFHDHKFRTPEAEARKWEYLCLNPVRARLADRPELWPFGGEIFYHEPGGPRLVPGTPPLLETGLLVEQDGTLRGGGSNSPGGGTRPTT